MNSALGERLRGLPGPFLVTGHTGFKGTWLTFLLERLNIPVVGFSRFPTGKSLFERANRRGMIREVFGDIRDSDLVLKCIEEFEPSVIIHLAAQPIVLESYRIPRETFSTNVLGTANILDAAFKVASVMAIGVVTTDKVYRNDNTGRAFIETDPLAGKDPYSASKVGAEAAVAAWQHIAQLSGGPLVISLRAGNVIGGGDWAPDRLLPDLIRGFISSTPTVVRNEESTRPWQHVLDPLRGYLMAIEFLLTGRYLPALNFGPDSESLTVGGVARISAEMWPGGAKIGFITDPSESHTEAKSLQLNSSLAKESLGWKMAWSQAESVRATVKWWDEVINNSVDPQKACFSDIEFLLSS
jgi:CDP-glucose 4,6-dehydratase